MLVAVRRAGGGVELHTIEPGNRRASLIRVLEPPTAGADALDVALSADASPAACVTWHTGPTTYGEDRQTRLVCYRSGSRGGTEVKAASGSAPVEVALSADGRRLAWAGIANGDNQALSTATLTGGQATGVRRFLARAGQPESGPQSFVGYGVQDLAWADGRVLAVSTNGESDESPGLLRLDTATARRGWLDEGREVEPDAAELRRGYTTFESVTSAGPQSALAVERRTGVGAEPYPPQRAVRVDLATGRVLDVVATAGKDRQVLSVSGTQQVVVYVTAMDLQGAGLTAYLRRAGEQRGAPVTGLPADTRQVVVRP